MSYLITHHGTYWFQIRVPKALATRYGHALIRQNLQTTHKPMAQALALQLAGQWLARFASERAFPQDAEVPQAVPAPPHPEYGPDALPPPEKVHETAESRVQARGVYSPECRPRRVSTKRTSEQSVTDSLEGVLGYWHSLNPGVRRSTVKEFESCVKQFKKTIRKRPADLQRSDIAQYRDKLIGAGLARATVGKKISFLSTLLQTVYDAGLLPQNVARGLRIPKAKVPDINRRAFTADELRRIFTSPVYSKGVRPSCVGGSTAMFVPMIALATGARLEEICMIKTKNIFVDPDHGPMLKISDEDEGQTVKTVSSRRTIPIHPKLVRAGLLDYWSAVQDASQEWLFPSLEVDHDGRRGGNFGKWFARYLRSKRGCGITDPKVVFHSFRHTFKTLCREAGITEEVHDALTGHVGQTVGRGYGHMPLGILASAVERIRFPISLPRIDY